MCHYQGCVRSTAPASYCQDREFHGRPHKEHYSEGSSDNPSYEKRLIPVGTQLEEGPHEYIEDPDIRAVWKEMGSRLSAKTRVFLDGE